MSGIAAGIAVSVLVAGASSALIVAGMVIGARRAVTKTLGRFDLTRGSAELYERAAKIFHQLETGVKPTGDFTQDFLSEGTGEQVRHWMTDYREEIK